MNRPYVICHILSSLDGKISGSFMAKDATRSLSGEYGKIRREMNAAAWLYGTTTIKEFTNFRKPVLEETASVPDGDFIVDAKAEQYYISVDTDGEIGWESGTFSNRGRSGAHVVEVLTMSTPTSYKAYLRKQGVSYIIAGKTQLDCKMAMEKLYQLFHIEKVLVCGGGVVNWSFLQAGMIDELSLLLAPVTDGGSGTASLFTQVSAYGKGEPVEFELKDVKQVGNGGLHLIYLAKNAENSAK